MYKSGDIVLITVFDKPWSVLKLLDVTSTSYGTILLKAIGYPYKNEVNVAKYYSHPIETPKLSEVKWVKLGSEDQDGLWNSLF